ncbi:SpoIIE family protein phosphatase [Dactylosporangium sp. NPDC000555]|uniref:SpoIIE family protein phosphatase n=1 Tax=Dactylosporangium sp. NPDC000555 TaxID=3154260 RepID=UPI00331F89F0
MVDGPDVLPPADVLAILDADPQGWAFARAVRDAATGEIEDFELAYLNEAGAGYLGRPRAELIGGRYRHMWPDTINDATMPLYRKVVEGREPATRTVYYDRPNVSGHFELWIGPSGDGFGVRFVDLRTVTLGPQSAGGTRLYDVLDAAFDGFMLLRAIRGPDGGVRDFVCEYVNRIGAGLTGRPAEETIGRHWSELTDPEKDWGLSGRWRTVVETGEPWRGQLRYASGQVWEINAARADAGSVTVSFRDVTDRALQQERVEQSMAQARRAAQRNAALQAVTSALVAASTAADVYAAIGSVLRPSAGGQGLALLLRRDDQLVLAYHAGYEPRVVERLREVPLTHPYPATEVARTGRPRYLSDLGEFTAAQAAGPGRAIPSGGRQAWAFLPLAVGGDVLGTLVVGYGTPREFDEDERANLAAFTGVCAQAMQRALLFEAQLSIAGELQRALLPAELPDVPGMRHAARYLPWTHGADVGGDWYDIIPLGGGVVAVVIGDVVGHSATAAAVMGQVRNALRAYAAERHSPAVVMQRVNRLLLDLQPDAVATCCYLELHLAEGTATAVLAGHPPPVLRAGAEVGTLALRPAPPLGVSADVAFVETTFLVPGGANLLLYTDGLVEDRRCHLDEGLAELLAAVRAAPSTDPNRMLDHVLAADVGPRPRTDDVALVCLAVDCRVEPAGGVRPAAQRRFRGDAISASAARRFAADVLIAWGEHRLVDDALLLLDEVITNAIQHTVGAVVVRLELGPRRLRVSVADRSDRLPNPRAAGADSENGRGLLIVASLSTAWGTQPNPAGGKEVWFEIARPA